MTLLMVFQEATSFYEWMRYPPGSMIFTLLLSLVTALISTLLTKLLVDTKEIERKQKQIKEHNEEKEKIIKLAEIDPERYRKKRKRWEKKDEMMKQLQQSMAMSRLKPTLIIFIPMIIIFSILNSTFGRDPIACPPMNPWDVPLINNFAMAYTNSVVQWTEQVYGTPIQINQRYGWINFTAWYFLCSLGINTLIQRILKLQTQASGGMDQMFGGQKAKYLQWPEV
ncbi:MAG: EMC3/TMCO1 family protein [Promethearchaeota archaeon]